MHIIQRLFFAFMGVIVLGVGAAVYVLVSTGQLDTLETHFTGHCVGIEGIAGPEDIIIHPSGNYAFISSTDRRAALRGEAKPGAIYLYDLQNPSVEPLNLTSSADVNFQPHGISFFATGVDQGILFVVNRPQEFSAKKTNKEVLLLNWKVNKTNAMKSVSVCISPNNIVAVGPDQFYVTNDFAYPDGIFADLQTILPLPVSTVGYFDGQRYRGVVEGLGFANGIALSPDGTQLFVTETLSKTLNIYNRDMETGALTLSEEIDLNTAPDNINIDQDGQIWLAAHPQLLSLYGHRGDAGKLSPSQILTLQRGAANQYVIKELLLDAGDLISGASVAAPIGDRFLIGGPYADKFLDCSR